MNGKDDGHVHGPGCNHDHNHGHHHHHHDHGVETVRNVHRDVGRNDDCPCGSGKKFKKCCLKG
jgi:uncharacterized protein YecA (UPF0149 family)